MKIIHFSDVHAGGPAEDWMAYIDKRWVGVFNFKFRRRFQHDLTLLEKAVAYILKEKPDLAVCTGDITSTGQPGEFKKSLDILEPLVKSDIPLVYVPGNHDYYVHNKKCVKAMKSAFEFINQGRFSFDALPLSFELSGIEFIVVNESFPSNLFSSCGYLKKKSMDFISGKCAGNPSAPRILIGHYPLLEDHPWLRVRHRLWGQKKAVELLASGTIDISLCGHVHKPYALIDEKGRGEICSGSVTRNSCMASIQYDSSTDIFKYEKISLKN